MSHNGALSPVPLPAPPSSFIGRRDEIAELKRILTDYRQVTLVGSGGCGNTRLAIRVAAEMAPHFPDGVAFVDLAAVEDGALVAPSVAAALSPGCEGTDGLTGLIGDRRILLVIDNAEQVVHGLAPLVADLLVRCPHVGALVTSRELLDISGERCWRVPPLGLPPADAPADPDLLATYDAIELFAIRAMERGGEFRLTPENARLVVSICRRLGGMPLALELAAGRVGSFGLEEIEDRLLDALRLLIGGTRTCSRPAQDAAGQHRLEPSLALRHRAVPPRAACRLRRAVRPHRPRGHGGALLVSSRCPRALPGVGKPMTVFEPASSNGTLSPQAARLPAETPLISEANQRPVDGSQHLTCKPHPERTRRVPLRDQAGDSTNWSGCETDNNNNDHAYAQADWTVPPITPPDKSPGNSSVIWPGVGLGRSGGALIQDGTGQHAQCLTQPPLCGTYNLNYYFRLEIYPDELMQQVINLVPSRGDSVGTSIEWLSPDALFPVA
jgi:hypothetical protein